MAGPCPNTNESNQNPVGSAQDASTALDDINKRVKMIAA